VLAEAVAWAAAAWVATAAVCAAQSESRLVVYPAIRLVLQGVFA